MKEKVIIFGCNDFAELAHFYLTSDSNFEVVAFSVNQRFINGDCSLFKGLPLVPFETVEQFFPTSSFRFFCPMSPSKMNRVRESVYFQIKQKGYSLVSYISSKATVFSSQIGENCFILENNVIQPFTSIGNNVILWSGNHIGHHSTIGNHVMFTSHVVLSGHCTVEDYCLFGVNSTIKDSTVVRKGTFLAMSSGLTKDSDEWSLYKGFPAIKSSISTLDI
jgi:sugar O-acyltransferase (sialic acid O-acetyltransferase NeuD family)